MPTWVLATFGWLFNVRIKCPSSELEQNKMYIPPTFYTENKGGVSPVTTDQFPTERRPRGGEARTVSFEQNAVIARHSKAVDLRGWGYGGVRNG